VSAPANDRERADFEQLFGATRADLLAYLLRRAPTVEDAADLLSETYLVAWKRLEVIPPGDEARLWLYGVARNLLMKNAGRRRSRAHLVDRLATELRSAQRTSSTANEEQAAKIRAALSTLREKDRELIMLAAWEDLTPTQIAAVLGTSANVVRVRLHRIRARIRASLASDTEAEPGCRAMGAHGIEPSRGLTH
jgi:RNA polymerase sigma-70 factor (ECF subfamily)